MAVLAAIGLAAMSALLLWLGRAVHGASRVIDTLACVSFFLFFVIAAAAVMRTLLDGTVFMTEVHSVLLHPLFLISGGYLGPYVTARTAALAWRKG